MGLERHIGTRDHLAALLDLPDDPAVRASIAERVVELIELMNLQSYRDKFVSELSTGVRRIVDLTMAIAHNPTVLLLDEPSWGVARRETEALGPLLKDMQRATQCSIVIIEHDMPLISAVSDEIIALDLGRVVTRGLPSAVLSDAGWWPRISAVTCVSSNGPTCHPLRVPCGCAARRASDQRSGRRAPGAAPARLRGRLWIVPRRHHRGSAAPAAHPQVDAVRPRCARRVGGGDGLPRRSADPRRTDRRRRA